MTYALADFGSTFTKVSLVADSGELLATAQHPTTIDSDVFDGYARARDEALGAAGSPRVDRALAASSAAGGLRMAAVGLVDDLTAAAARRSALSAGAKVEAVWSGALGAAEAGAIARDAPDVVLFAGGTDGGARDRVLANARAVAGAGCGAAVVVACNRDVSADVAEIFSVAGHETVVVDNVLPGIDREHSAPAREAIRKLFIRRVIQAKGMSRAEGFFDAVLMPSPAAVLACAELLAAGTARWPGLGSVVILDVGGATTDVHSVVPPTGARRLPRAGPAPETSARTVEGDLGVRFNADGVLAQDEAWIARHLGRSPADLRSAVQARRADPSFVPGGEDADGRRLDRALATSCMALAVERHTGRLATRYVPGEGAEVVLDGRDLRDARIVLATGGSIVRDATGATETVKLALSRVDAGCPAPRAGVVLIDASYVVAAAGLLATVDPDAAFALLAREVPGLCSA